ncbi:hypothetical protein [Kitasatospora sp. NBC_01300]|uniref:hypothetical protein n=1 Tax=Kitasatospora sp. NBC_01300 TaxID=2903574 RepID=UPI00352D58D0|nr:hypothetical protein OG556_16105 [Kitasatospora sp. NBC_01300]
MGRRANPLPAEAGPHLHALAVALRRMKAASGLTYTALAKRTKADDKPKGASTLSQAAAGHRLPRLDTVLAFARAAADPADAHARHQAEREIHSLWAAVAVQRSAPPAGEQAAPPVLRDPEHVGPAAAGPAASRRPRRTMASLGLGLRRIRARAGQPSLKVLEDLSKAAGCRVPKSTVDLILAGRALPTQAQLEALLTAFDDAAGPGRRAVLSRRKWTALRDYVESRTRPAPLVRVTGFGCVDGSLEMVLERRDRDEGIKRKVGKLAEDEAEEQDEYSLGVASGPAPWELMDDEELAAWEQEALEADRAYRSGRDLLAELREQMAGG